MTLVHIDLRLADNVTPAVGTIYFTPSRRVTTSHAWVTTPGAVPVTLVNGVADVELEPTGAGWAYLVYEATANGGRVAVAVQDSVSTINYAALVRVALNTLEPASSADIAAWEAAVDTVQTLTATATGAAAGVTAAATTAITNVNTAAATAISTVATSTGTATTAATTATTAAATATSASGSANGSATTASTAAGTATTQASAAATQAAAAAASAVAAAASAAAAGSTSPIVADGIADWWIYPAAVYQPTPSPRTYYGSVSKTAKITVGYFDHLLAKVKRYEVGTATVIDDHCAPSISVLPGYRTLIGWTDHSDTQLASFRVSGVNGDLTELGPLTTFNLGGAASYTQDHRSLANPDVHYLLSRVWMNAAPYDWSFYTVTVNPVDGSLTFGTKRQLLLSEVGRQPYITSAPITLAGGNQGLALALSDNPDNGLNKAYYATIDLVTGAVASPGKTLTANVFTGVGLPLAFADLDLAYDAGTGKELRLFNVRPGTGLPAILCASGTEGATFSSDATYHEVIRAFSANPGLQVTSTSGVVSTPANAVFNTPSLKVRVDATYTTQLLSKALVRKYGTVDGQRTFQLTTLGTGKLRLVVYPTGLAASALTMDSTVVPNASAIGLGFEFNPNNGTNRTTSFWETLDNITWTQVGTTISSTTTTLFAGTAPVEIGASGTSALGTVRKMQWFDAAGGSTVVAGPDFTDATKWINGEAAGAAHTGVGGVNTWTLAGTVVIAANGWQKTDFGLAGSTVAPATPSYIAGACYPIVASPGNTKYFARELAGTWTIEKVTKGDGGVQATTVLATTNGGNKFLRPLGILNQGPFDVVYSKARTYTGYNNYDADVLGV